MMIQEQIKREKGKKKKIKGHELIDSFMNLEKICRSRSIFNGKADP